MKKLFLLLIVVFICAISRPVKAQQYIPIPLDSSMWKVYIWVSHPWPVGGCGCYVYEYSTSDTVINSKNYTLIRKFYDNACLQCIGFANSEKFAVRQDSLERKLYIIRLPDSLTERILYDFTQIAGDTCNSILYKDPTACGALLISSVDSVFINNKYHKRLNLHGGCLINGGGSFIEGIGSTLGFINDIVNFECGSDLVCAHNYSNSYITFFPNSSVICDSTSIGINENYSKNDNVTITPNPFSHYTMITFDQAYQDIALEVYDIQGKLMVQKRYGDCSQIQFNRNQLSNGLYFLKLTLDNDLVETAKIIVSD